MSKVITFSRVFPSYHPKKGEPTFFVEKLYNSIFGLWDWGDAPGNGNEYVMPLETNTSELKHHTIRSGNRWEVGDKFSPRVWSGKPYCSPMVTIAPDIEIKKIWDFEISDGLFLINGEVYAYSSSTELLNKLASNDGLEQGELMDWFKYPKEFKGQIICWNESVEY